MPTTSIVPGAGVPSVMELGNTYLFTETYQQWPASKWTAQLIMQIRGQAPLTFNATTYTDNVSFLFSLTNFSVPIDGRYEFAEYATEIATGDRQTAKTGVIEVIPNLSTQQAISTAATMLANIESAITGLLSGGFMSVSVNNVSYTRYDLSTLIAMRTRLQAEVFREHQAADAFRGVETSGRIGTRFKPTPAGTPFFSKDIGE